MDARPPGQTRYSPIERVALWGIALGTAVSLAACGSGGGTSTAGSSDTSSENWEFADQEITCGEWFSEDTVLRDGLIAAKAAEVSETDPFDAYFEPDKVLIGSSGGQPRLHLLDGELLEGYEAVVDYACSGAELETSVFNAVSKLSPSAYARCEDFNDGSKTMREMWLAAAADLQGSDEGTDAVASACKQSGESHFATAVADTQSVLDSAAEEAAKIRVGWRTESQLGYSTKVELLIGALQRGDKPHPDRTRGKTSCDGESDAFGNCEGFTKTYPAFEIGFACGFDPETDALIPLTVTAENTTEGYSATVAYAFTVEQSAVPKTVSVSVAGYYGGDIECLYADQYSPGSVRVSAKFLSPFEPGDRGDSQFFVVLHDYYSPKHPKGNKADLDRFVVKPASQYDEDDPIIDIKTGKTYTLSGKLA